jgi:acetoin utilization protein AcuB
MSKPIPTIQKYMTTSPHTVGAEQTLAFAHGLMQEHRIRHLPVLRGGRLAGILTQRDIALVEGLKDVDPLLVLVEDAMNQEIFTVSPDAPLDEVVSEMAEHKYGSVIIVQNSKVVGIFTAVDACSTLAQLLHGRLAK